MKTYKMIDINETIIDELINQQINIESLDKILLDIDKEAPLEISKIIYSYIDCKDCKMCCKLCILNCSFMNECFRNNVNTCCKFELKSLNKRYDTFKKWAEIQKQKELSGITEQTDLINHEKDE